MIIGDYNQAKIVTLTDTACFLDTGGEADIYMPIDEVPEGAARGDKIEVFLYNPSKDEVKATTVKPSAAMGGFAALEVTDSTSFGVFLDWGLPKDLLVPTRNLRADLSPGDIAVVKIVPDFDGIGVVGTCKFDELFDDDFSSLYPNKKVDILVFGISPLGARVIIDNRFQGLLYRNEIFEKLRIGDSHTGYIKKIRDDGLIDAALQPQGFLAASKEARTIILDALEDSNGYLPLNDKSSADDINSTLCMSKKVFKKTIGGLYKEKKISIEPDGLRLLR
ncbi:MAG: hypothetical protein JEZ04_06280 [Spirochaetales bacterium]|nr:hypothetical protein [Spirochaetales bacterium]